MAAETGVIYFKINDGYEGDITNNCSLTEEENDKNVHFLRGHDIKSGAWFPNDGGYLELERYDGSVIRIEGVSFSPNATLSGSSFTTQSGGTLALTINGGEPYYITGIANAIAELLTTITSAVTEGGCSDSAITGDIDEIIAELDRYEERFILINRIIGTDIPQDITELENRIGVRIDSLCDSISTEIRNRSNADQNLSTQLNNHSLLIQKLTSDLSSISNGFYNDIRNLFDSVQIIQAVIEDITISINGVREEINTRVNTEKQERQAYDELLGHRISQEIDERRRESSIIQRNIEGYANYNDNEFDRVRREIETVRQSVDGVNAKIDESNDSFNDKLAEEQIERQNLETELRANIADKTNKISELNERIETEKVVRAQADFNLQSQVTRNANENERLSNDLNETKSALRNERNERTEGDANLQNEIIETNRSILTERAQRIQSFATLSSNLENYFSYTEDQIEAVKRYAELFYTDDNSDPNVACENVRWGVVLQEYTDLNGDKKHKFVLNLDPNDKFLSQNCNYLASSIKLRYNSLTNHIELLGNNDTVVSSIDANIFIQRGFLKGASVDNDNKQLVLVWDGNIETRIPFGDMFKAYTGGTGINMTFDEQNDKYIVEVSILNDDPILTFDSSGRLVSRNIDAHIKSLASEVLNNAINSSASTLGVFVRSLIQDLSDSVERELRNKLDKSVFEAYTASTKNALSGISQNINNIAQDVETNYRNITGITSIVNNLGSKVNTLENDIYGTSGLTERIEEVERDLALKSAQLETIQDNMSDVQHGLSGVTEWIQNTETGLTYFENRLDSCERNVRTCQSGITVLQTWKTETNSDISVINRRLTELEANSGSTGGGISEEILDKLDEFGNKTNPSASITLKVKENGSSTIVNARACEVGTTIEIVETQHSFNSGSYQYGPDPTGVEVSDTLVKIKNNALNFTDTAFTVTDDTNVKAEITVYYTAGVTPKTKLGRDDNNPAHAIPSGSTYATSSIVKGYRNSFYKSVTTVASSFSESYIKDGAQKSSGTTFNLTINSGDKEVIIAIPAAKTLSKVLDTNFNNSDIRENFIQADSNVQIGGVNNSLPISYKVYYYVPDAPFSVNNIYKITIA